MHEITLFPETKFKKNVMGWGTNPVVRETPLPTPIRTYGASILGFLAPTKLDTRHPLSKILDPPLRTTCVSINGLERILARLNGCAVIALLIRRLLLIKL